MKKILATILAAALGLGAWGAPGITDGVTDNPAAAIGSTGYATLADAIAAVNPGDTVTLMQDVTLNATLELTKSMTLDLNGKTLSKTLASTTDTTPVIKALSGTVEIKNGSITYDHSTFTGTGAVSKPSVLFVGMNMSNGVYSYGDCNLTLKGVNVSVTFPSGKAAMTMVYVESGRLNIVDSNLSATTGASNTKTQYMIYTTAHASAAVDPYVSISGTTTIDTNGKPGIHAIWLQGSKDTLIISGNDVTISADATWKPNSYTTSYGYAINNQSGATCTIEGGKFAGKVWQTKGTITVYGGTFSYPQGTSGQKNKFTLAEGVEYVENTDPATKDEYPYLVGAPASYVAQVISVDGATTNKYENLMEAINVAYNGGTVELLADVTVDHWHQNIWTLAEGSAEYPEGMLREPTAGPNGLTINGNGHSLTINGIDSAGNGNHIFAGSRNLTVSNITINAASGVNGIGLKSGTISDVTFNMAGSNPAIYTSGSAGCEEGEHIEIRNCTFNTSASDSYGIYSCDPENGVDSGTIISGNTFNTRRSVALRSDMQFLNNTVNGAKGVTVARGSTAVVRGNYFADTTTSRSINVYPSNATIENNVILGPIELENETYAVAPDLSNNYWGGNAPANLPEGVVVNSYYTTYSGYDSPAQDGSLFVLSDPVETYVAQIGDTKYATLADAIAAVPTDGTETTITMIGDEAIVGNVGVTVAAGKNITLDLNGHTISQTGPMAGAGYLIKNNGTLTLKDSTDTAKNGTGTGMMTTSSANPDTGDIPSYANNLISNYGTLTIESGNYKSLTNAGYASFVVDNYSGGTANITGGKLSNTAEYAYVVRMFLNSTTAENALNISGGIIEGSYAVWMQYPNSNANKASLNVTGGTITATDGYAVYAGGNSACDASNIDVSFSGGTVGGSGVRLNTGSTAFNSIEVTGGDYAGFSVTEANENFISGGTFGQPVNEAYCADGYIPADADPVTGKYTVKQGTYVAQIGEVKYASLADAIAAAPADGTETTITMIEDSAETVGSTVAAGQKIVLDLNGKAVSYESAFPAAFNLIAVNGILTVTDTSEGANGSIALTSTANLSWDYAVNMFLVGNGGSLTIEKGSYSVTTPSYGYAEYVIAASNNNGASTVVINGGTFTGNNIDAVVRLHDQYGRNQPLNVTVNGGDFTLNGSQCDSVIWFDVQKSGNGTDNASVANLVINGGTFTSTSASPALDIGHSVDASGLRVTVAGGAFKSNGAVIKTRELSAAAIANIKLSGGIYSGDEYYNDLTKTTDKLDTLCAAGYKVANNIDDETKDTYPYVVGLVKVFDIAQQPGATETRATYVVTVVAVDEDDQTVGTFDDALTVEVSIAAVDASGSTLAKYDVSKILDTALLSAGEDAFNVTKVEICVVISAPTSGEGTVSYEVHPEAVVTVTKDATDTTTIIPLSNACLAADASFTFDLDATGVVAAGNWAKVTHVSTDPNYAAEARNLKAVAGDGGKVYVTVTTTHFSTFTIGSGVPPVTFGVRSDNLFGSIKIAENVASNLYVAVPFEGFEADGALRKAQDVVHATNLTAGTKMYVYDKTADKYDVFEVDANGKWAAADKLTVNVEGKATFDTADLTRGVTNGTGVIVGRKNTAETVYVYGQVPKIPIASTTFGAGQTLVSPPYTNGVAYVDLNASKWTEVKATQLKRLKNQKGADYIQFRTAENRLVKYFYLEGEGWGVTPTQVSQCGELVANGKALIPVGTAFWYYSTSGGAKVEWK